MTEKGGQDQIKPAAFLMLDEEEEGDGSWKREARKTDTNSVVSFSSAPAFVENEASLRLDDHFPLPIEHNKDDSGLLVDEQRLLYIQQCFGNTEQDPEFLSVVQDTNVKDNRESHSSPTHNHNTANKNTANKNVHDSSANDEAGGETKGTKSNNATTKTSFPSTSEGDSKKLLEQQAAPNAKPKRPMSAYNHFFKMKRAELVRQQPDIQFADIGKVIGKAWKALEAHDLKTFERLANRDIVRYRRRIELWRRLRRLRLKGGGTIDRSNGGRVVSIFTVEDVNDTKVRAEERHNDRKKENDVTQRPACRPIYHYDQHDTARCSNKSPTTTAASFQVTIKEQKEGNATPPIPFFSWNPDAVATQTSRPAISTTAAVVSSCSPLPPPFGVHNDYWHHRTTPPHWMNSSPAPPVSQHQPFPYYYDCYDSAYLHHFYAAPLPLHHCRPPFASYGGSGTTSTDEVVAPKAPPRLRGSLFSGNSSSSPPVLAGNNVGTSLSCFEYAADPRSSSYYSISPLPFGAPPLTYHHIPLICPTSPRFSYDSGSKNQSTTTMATATARSCASPEQEARQERDSCTSRKDKQASGMMKKPAANPGPWFLPNSTQQPSMVYSPPEDFAHHYDHHQEYGSSTTLQQNHSQYYSGTVGLDQHFQVLYKCVRMRKSQVGDYIKRFCQQQQQGV